MSEKCAAYEGKEKYIHEIFTDIAPVYERVNHMLSFNLDRYWRRRAIDRFFRSTHRHVLDACCGTGESTELLRRRIEDGSLIVGIDFCEDMLARAVARHKDDRRIRYETANIQQLRFEDRSFDAVYNCFALRNLTDIPGAIQEMRRVLKPGGQMVIIDLTRPEALIWRWYLQYGVPFIGRMCHGDHGPYTYLASSIRHFCRPAELGERMTAAGLRQVEYIEFLGGVVTAACGTA